MSNINLFSASKKRKQNRIIFPVGTHTWKVPDNVREVEVHVWGGGGNAGGWNPNSESVGAGGGGGGYVRHLYKVTSGDSFSIVVGGQGGTSSVASPSNPFPQPITATGGSDAPIVTTTPFPSSGISSPLAPAPILNGVPYPGGAGGTGSIASIPVPLRVVGFTTTASGGSGGGITDLSTAGLWPIVSPTYIRHPIGWKGNIFGASGGAAGSHLGNGGNGAPAWSFNGNQNAGGYTNPFLSASFSVIGGVGGGGIGNRPGISHTTSADASTNPSEPVSYKLEISKGGSAGFPDLFPAEHLGIRNVAGDVREYLSNLPASQPFYNLSATEINWFYVEEILGTNYYSTKPGPTNGVYTTNFPSGGAGSGAPGDFYTGTNPDKAAPFLGGGKGAGYLSGPTSQIPFAYQDKGGPGSVGGGGGGGSVGGGFGAQPLHGTGGVGCVIIYW